MSVADGTSLQIPHVDDSTAIEGVALRSDEGRRRKPASVGARVHPNTFPANSNQSRSNNELLNNQKL
jgi:hypothetical protein